MHERPWLKNYPVRWNLNYPEISLYEFLQEATTEYPERVALIFMGSEVTYKEMQQNIDRTANALAGLGVSKGDRVALMLPNCPQYVYSYYACMKLGAIVVQLNPLYTSNEVEFVLNDSGAKVIVAVDTVFGSFHAVRHKVAVEHAIVARMLWTEVEGENLFFDDLLQQTLPQVEHAKINPREDLAVFQYTGGTTGFPKAVMLSHFNLTSNVIQIREWITPYFKHRNDINDLEGDWWSLENRRKYRNKVTPTHSISLLPYFHSYGMTSLMNGGLTMPSTQVLLPRLDIDALLALIKQYKPSTLPAIPTIYVAMANHPEAENSNLDCIDICNSGAAPMPVEVMEHFEKRTGAKVLEGYGLSEASPVTHSNPFVGKRKPGSVGFPYPDTDCRIVDIETGARDMAPGEEGELIIKGPQVMQGYWNRPEETAQTLRDGWLYTGDIAKMDEEGYFYIVDRKKDMVITGGYNVYPREVDEVLFEHPKVLEAVAAGIPDNYYGEVLKAYIVLKNGETATAEEILDHCRTKLARYKVPRQIEFRKELPKSAIGKILRRVLVDEERQKGSAGA
ncbi:MAG: long-chain fatty acid--CoA ligase [Dethiobacter sp.]|nr:long-chain fatty acid--CoA ligase [Dethiobacter sp.]